MNGYSLTAALVWAAVVVVGLWRGEIALGSAVSTLLTAWRLSQQTVVASQAVSAEEVARIQAASALDVARLQLPATSPSSPRSFEIVLPDDLEAHVNTWSDEWARDDARGDVRAKYLEFHTGDSAETWQKVRRAVGLGEMP